MCWRASPARKPALVVIVVSSAPTLKESLPRAAPKQSERLVQLKPAITAAKRLRKFFGI